jgi:hypothetical protein
VPVWCVAPLEMNEGNSMGQGYNRPTGCSAEKALHATFNFFLHITEVLSVFCLSVFCSEKRRNITLSKLPILSLSEI